jgi:phage terminase large subunit GpA-like protein
MNRTCNGDVFEVRSPHVKGAKLLYRCLADGRIISWERGSLVCPHCGREASPKGEHGLLYAHNISVQIVIIPGIAGAVVLPTQYDT